MPVAHSIETLLAEYHAQPLARMREIGLQARLHALITTAVKRETCRVQVHVGALPDPVRTRFRIQRVQMEARVTVASDRGTEKSDIVLLRSTRARTARPITATRYPNGPFDVVSKLHLCDVETIVEVKAACSADFGQRHRFREDVRKLLRLAQACDAGQPRPELHFVLVDKSVGLGGTGYGAVPLPRCMPVFDWHTETPARLKGQTPNNVKRFWPGGPALRMLNSAPPGVPYVHVWELGHVRGAANDAVSCRYAALASEKTPVVAQVSD